MPLPLPPPPLSPHLQIYRPQWTSVLSILHRITGVALTVGLPFLTWFLYALADGPDSFRTFTNFAGSILGTILLMGWSAALIYHGCAGVRHLIFDTGSLLHPRMAERAGQIVFGVAVLLTLGLWACVLGT